METKALLGQRNVKRVVLPGDGVGPEVIAQATRILHLIEETIPVVHLNVTTHLFGGAAIDTFGEPLPQATLDACLAADAVLLGPVGGPQWENRPEAGTLALRKALGTYASLRPISFPSPALVAKSSLKPDVVSGTSIFVVRELLGGGYYSERGEAGLEEITTSAGRELEGMQEQAEADDSGEEQGKVQAWDRAEYCAAQIQRIAHFAGLLASQSTPPLQVYSVDKSNLLATSRLWRAVVTSVFGSSFSALKLNHLLVDNAAMILATRPRELNGVLLCDNLFGDILGDEIAALPGSLGIIPSACLTGPPSAEKAMFGIYEPVHGTSHPLAGRDLANPTGCILALSLLFRYSLALEPIATAIERAVAVALDTSKSGGKEAWTQDLGGKCGTQDVGDRVIDVLRPLLKQIGTPERGRRGWR